MLKRKLVAGEPNFWKKNDFFIVPFGYRTFKKLRDEFPTIRVLYIKNCTPMASCKEIMIERDWETTTSDYYIIDNDSNVCIKKFQITLKNKEIKWNGVNFIYRNTVICSECFIIGELTPEKGCLTHIPKCVCMDKKHSKLIVDIVMLDLLQATGMILLVVYKPQII